MNININSWSYLAQYVLEWEMFQTKFIEKIKNTHFVFSDFYLFINFFFRKSCHLLEDVEEYCRAGQVTHDIMSHAHCMLDN